MSDDKIQSVLKFMSWEQDMIFEGQNYSENHGTLLPFHREACSHVY